MLLHWVEYSLDEAAEKLSLMNKASSGGIMFWGWGEVCPEWTVGGFSRKWCLLAEYFIRRHCKRAGFFSAGIFNLYIRFQRKLGLLFVVFTLYLGRSCTCSNSTFKILFIFLTMELLLWIVVRHLMSWVSWNSVIKTRICIILTSNLGVKHKHDDSINELESIIIRYHN